MKAELTKDGYLKVTAETVTEAWALKVLLPAGADPCTKCGQLPFTVMIDGSILSEPEPEHDR